MPLRYPDLDAAIAQYEGFLKPDSLAQRQNNPGNLKYGPFAERYGATPGDKGFASFPDVQSGVLAMDSLVDSYAQRGYTMGDMLERWNGNGPNTKEYQDFVSDKTGKSITQRLKEWMTSPKWSAGIEDVPGATYLDTLGQIADLSVTRFVAFLLGIICIIAGLFFLKPTQDIIVTAAKGVGGVVKAAV
jgi:hypothetical protein